MSMQALNATVAPESFELKIGVRQFEVSSLGLNMCVHLNTAILI